MTIYVKKIIFISGKLIFQLLKIVD